MARVGASSKPVYTGRMLAEQVARIDKHVGECVICRRWHVHKYRHDHCHTLRVLVAGMLRIWQRLPASDSARQGALFDTHLDVADVDLPAPY